MGSAWRPARSRRGPSRRAEARSAGGGRPRVEVGEALGDYLFEVLPGRFVRILPFVCRLTGGGDVVISHEHLETRWLPIAELAARIHGHLLPEGYLGAIRQVIDQRPSSHVRTV